MVDLYAARDLYEQEHLDFRDSVREFLEREVVPHIEEWEEIGDIPRAIWNRAGDLGYLGLNVPEAHGGAGICDYRFRQIMIEECGRAGATSMAGGFAVHTDIVLPYLFDLANPEQAKRWLPRLASGAAIGAIAMTEPEAGSDLQGIRTTAVRDGDHWILNGSKTFISNGIHADVVIVVARTDLSPTAGSGAFTLFVVEEGTPGFSRGKRLKKVGLKAQDTAELIFEDVRLSDDQRLGDVGAGLYALMSHLPLERISIAAAGASGSRAALQWTIEYVNERQAFGKPIASFQNTQFTIAEMVTELEVTQAYIDAAVLRLNQGKLSAVDAAKAKWWATEAHKRTVDRCLQLFGGYGYMLEYPIARAYADTRITTIFGGTTEIMKMIIARDVLGPR